MQAVTINYHHTTGSRAPSLDDDEEEEDRLHAMISMICSRNLTDPNVLKGFYHLYTPIKSHCPIPTPEISPQLPMYPLVSSPSFLFLTPPTALPACLCAICSWAHQWGEGWSWLHLKNQVQMTWFNSCCCGWTWLFLGTLKGSGQQTKNWNTNQQQSSNQWYLQTETLHREVAT